MMAADSGFEINYSGRGIMVNGEKIISMNNQFLFSGVGDYSLIEQLYKDISKKVAKQKEIDKIRSDILDEFAEAKHDFIKRMKISRGLDSEEDDESIQEALYVTLIMARHDEKEGNEVIVISNDALLNTFKSDTNGLSMLAIGEGEDIANAYLSKLSSIGQAEGKLDTKVGSFVAYKVIKDTMKVSPGKLMEPISMVVMDKEGIKRLSSEDLSKLERAYVTSVSEETALFERHVSMLRSEGAEKSKNVN
ncbi:MAG: hypothetical protein M1360_00245 [Candidatus Marsarchaeota archaeon]|nr:hypothetical protein [Candidatus Marsarchaeota archaeon]